jgi:hypothetical protein
MSDLTSGPFLPELAWQTRIDEYIDFRRFNGRGEQESTQVRNKPQKYALFFPHQ